MQDTPEAIYARNVRLRRRHLGMSQVEVGSLVGLDGTAVARIESNQRGIRLNEAVALADALDEPFRDLMDARYERRATATIRRALEIDLSDEQGLDAALARAREALADLHDMMTEND